MNSVAVSSLLGRGARLLFGLVNSLVEWYRPTGSSAGPALADAVCAIAFDGLRVRRSRASR